jgi:hypothetical protein
VVGGAAPEAEEEEEEEEDVDDDDNDNNDDDEDNSDVGIDDNFDTDGYDNLFLFYLCRRSGRPCNKDH